MNTVNKSFLIKLILKINIILSICFGFNFAQSQLNNSISSIDIQDINIYQLSPTHFGSAQIVETTLDPRITESNAIEEIKTQYYIQNQLGAEVLIQKSLGQICNKQAINLDRLDGKNLKNIFHIELDGNYYLGYEITNKNQLEYGVFFSGYIENDSLSIESFWNTNDYSTNHKFYSFQIRAKNLELACVMAQMLLDNLTSKFILKQVKNSTIPEVFIEKVTYKQGKLQMKIHNKAHSKYATLIGMKQSTEDGSKIEFIQELYLSGDSFQTIEINSGYLYDCNLKLESNGIIDEIFIQDGKWKLNTSFNTSSHLNHFRIIEENHLVSSDDFQIERGLDINLQGQESVDFKRFFNRKKDPIDLSNFNSIELDVYGQGLMKITLIDTSISNWDNQLTFQIKLHNSEEHIALNIHNFKNYISQNQLKNISHIDIAVLKDDFKNQSLALNLSNLKFSKDNLNSYSIKPEIGTRINLHPMPTSDFLYIEDLDQTIESIEIFNMDGNKIYQTATQGLTTQINAQSYPTGTYIINIRHTDKTVTSREIQIGL